MASTAYDPMDRAGLEFWLHTQAGDNSERRRRLLRNLPKAVAAELTPRQREVLALYMERDMNVTQIAAVLGVNKSTVRSADWSAACDIAFDPRRNGKCLTFPVPPHTIYVPHTCHIRTTYVSCRYY